MAFNAPFSRCRAWRARAARCVCTLFCFIGQQASCENKCTLRGSRITARMAISSLFVDVGWRAKKPGLMAFAGTVHRTTCNHCLSLAIPPTLTSGPARRADMVAMVYFRHAGSHARHPGCTGGCGDLAASSSVPTISAPDAGVRTARDVTCLSAHRRLLRHSYLPARTFAFCAYALARESRYFGHSSQDFHGGRAWWAYLLY